jgi:polyisoprenoid-binding protein YceI
MKFSRINPMRRMMVAAVAATTVATLGLALPALAAALKTDTAKSTVSIVFKQLGVPVNAMFQKFTAVIDFDGAKPDAAKASVDIDAASFDLGDPEYNKEVMKKEWFNVAQFPKATFVSTSIKTGAAGRFDVAGKLSIKGKTTDVTFPLSVKKEGNTQIFDGELPIKRLTYNIGEGDWKDTSTVADEVVIKFHVVTTP